MDTFEKKFKNIDTEELVKIVYTDRENYQESAINAAEHELLLRGINKSSDIVKSTISDVTSQREEHDATGLTKKGKILFFICGMFFIPFFFAVISITLLEPKRGKTKTKESWKYLWSGLITILVVNLIVLFVVFLI